MWPILFGYFHFQMFLLYGLRIFCLPVAKHLDNWTQRAYLEHSSVKEINVNQKLTVF